MRAFEIDWWPKRIVSGEGSAQNLRLLADGLGRRRAFVVCGRSIAASRAFATVRAHLGDMFVGAFTHVEMHAPLNLLDEAAELVRENGADLIVSLGGGSAIDSGKGICLIHGVGKDYSSYALSARPGAARVVPELELAHIAIPTTTGSGSEVSPTCGLRDAVAGHKRIFRSDRLIPDAAIFDPQLLVETPASLTACSGMTAVARCVEALYSGRRNPFRSALALHGLLVLTRDLPVTIARPQDLDARANCLAASAMSAIAANVNTSAVHAVGHVVGGRCGLQHGVPHAILLPSGMRLMLPVIGEDQKLVMRALDETSVLGTADEAGQRASELMAEFISRLPIPRRLRDIDVERSALPSLAEQASHDPILISSGATLTAEDIGGMLERAY